jgi:hypothetical protein
MLTDKEGRDAFGPAHTPDQENMVFKLFRTKNDEDYKIDCLAVNIKHTLNSAHVRYMIEQATQLYGKDFVLDAAGVAKSPATMAAPYMVVPTFDVGAPDTTAYIRYKRYGFVTDAEDSARKLLAKRGKHPGAGDGDTRVHVVQILKTFKLKAAEPEIVEE